MGRRRPSRGDVHRICLGDAPRTGPVWSSLYLDDEERAQWLERRGLESWGGPAEWGERGTEHAAEAIAFGLLDWWVTPHIYAPDVASLEADFQWLLGTKPLHLAPTPTVELWRVA